MNNVDLNRKDRKSKMVNFTRGKKFQSLRQPNSLIGKDRISIIYYDLEIQLFL